jgi:hypothetical protein
MGKESVVGVRTNSNGQVEEQIVAVPTENHDFMPVTTEGVEFDNIGSETWRFYLQGVDGQRKELRFLKTRDSGMPWQLIAPLSRTNLWVIVEERGTLRGEEKGKWNYRVRCFNRDAITDKRVVAFPADGKFRFDRDTDLIVYKMSPGEIQHDPLSNAGGPR